MAFTNRIRLPFKISKPQFPEDKTVYRFANGQRKTLSVVVNKTYAGETDYMPEKWHQRLTIALAHDNITIEGDKYLGGVSKDGDYEIAWPDFLDYPTGKAAFSVFVTPFDNTNSNCQTCEEATQLSLVDDAFPDTLEEDTTYTLNVYDNDNVCCYPAVFSITSYDTGYLASASIDQEGILTIKTKTSGYASANGIKLVTYRVTCPNGGFDEADVFADVEGDEPAGCLAPSNIVFSSTTQDTADLTFTPSPSVPDHYLWRLYKASAPGILVQSGTCTPTLHLTGLDPSTGYLLFIRSQCGPGNDDASASNFIEGDFSTVTASDLCGSYEVQYDNFETDPRPPTYAVVIYLDCNGEYQHVNVPNHNSRTICAAQASPGVPTDIDSSVLSAYILINYVGLC